MTIQAFSAPSSPPLMKGAMVRYSKGITAGVPNVVVFQYNPETIQHDWSQPSHSDEPGQPSGNPTAVTGVPGERFSFTLFFDAYEDISRGLPPAAAIAQTAGVGARIAALEMMLYPTSATELKLVGTVSASAGNPASAANPPRAVPDSTVPFVILILGPSRVVGVKVTSLGITETYYDAFLNPVRAQVQIELAVLTPAELISAQQDDSVMADLAKAAYLYTLAKREALSVAQLGDSASSILGMIPH